MKLSIVIPIYNEGPHLERFFEHFYCIEFPCPTELILVDDHSTDKSWEIIQKQRVRSDTRIHRQEKNMGKGCALQKGFELATGDIIAIQDADFEYNPKELVKLILPILKDNADVVYGSRFTRTTHNVHRTYHYLANRFLTFLSNLFSGLYLSDMETCYKVFRADILKGIHLKSKRFGFEPEITAKIAKLRLRVREYPISYNPRTHNQGKKITWRDGISAIWCILKYNLASRKSSINTELPQKYLRDA